MQMLVWIQSIYDFHFSLINNVDEKLTYKVMITFFKKKHHYINDWSDKCRAVFSPTTDIPKSVIKYIIPKFIFIIRSINSTSFLIDQKKEFWSWDAAVVVGSGVFCSASDYLHPTNQKVESFCGDYGGYVERHKSSCQ